MILNSEIENKIKLDSLILKQNITKLKDSLTMLKRQISDNQFFRGPQTAKSPNLQLIKNKTLTKTKKKKKQSRKVIMKTTPNSRTNLNTHSNSNTNYNTNANSNSKTIEKSKLVSKGIIAKPSITNNQKLNIKNTNTVHRSMTPGYKFKVNQTKALQQININNNMVKNNRLPVNKPNQNNMNSNKKKSKPKPKENPNQQNNELILLRKENKLLKQRLQTESTKNNQLTQMIDNFNSQFR